MYVSNTTRAEHDLNNLIKHRAKEARTQNEQRYAEQVGIAAQKWRGNGPNWRARW